MMPEMSVILPLVALLMAAAAVAGFLAGLLGVGGGILLVPAFFVVFTALGYDGAGLMQICLATSLATIVVTGARSVAAHHRRGAVDWDVLRGFALPIGLGALVGVWVAARLASETLQAIFGGLALLVGAYFAFGRAEWRLGDRMPGGAVRLGLGTVMGFLSVLLGIGGGSVGVPLLTLFGTPMHRAVATAAGFGLLIAVPSVLAFMAVSVGPDAPPFTLGAVNGPAFAIAIAMTLITAPLGARAAHSLPPVALRRVFAAFILVVALSMIGAL